MSSAGGDDLDRRFGFQRAQQSERLNRADEARRETQRRQDERDAKRREDQKQQAIERKADREMRRNHSLDMYEQKRHDKLSDASLKGITDIEEQKEVTRREVLLRELGTKLYQQTLDADYAHDIRTRNIDVEEHKARALIDAKSTIDVDNNRAKLLHKELRERLKAYIIEKLTDHAIAESSKRSAHSQKMELTEAESNFQLAEIRERSSAAEREIWTQNEANKDFELFMSNLRQGAEKMSEQEISDILDKLNRANR